MSLAIASNCLVGAEVYTTNYYLYNCAAPQMRFNVNKDIAQGSTEFEVKDEIKAGTKSIKKSGRDYSSTRITSLERAITLSMTTNETTLPFIDYMEQIFNSTGACAKLSGNWGYICEKISPNGKRVYLEFKYGTLEPKNGGSGLNKDSETEFEVVFTRNDDDANTIYYSIGQVFIPSEFTAPTATFKAAHATNNLTITEFVLTDPSGFAPTNIIFTTYDDKGVILSTTVKLATDVIGTSKTVTIPATVKPAYVQASFDYAPGTSNVTTLCPLGLVKLA